MGIQTPAVAGELGESVGVWAELEEACFRLLSSFVEDAGTALRLPLAHGQFAAWSQLQWHCVSWAMDAVLQSRSDKVNVQMEERGGTRQGPVSGIL